MKLPPQTPETNLDMRPYEPVPFEKRASQTLGAKDYLWEALMLAIYAKVGALLGYGAAKLMKRPDQEWNLAYLGGAIGGLAKTYTHWAKKEGANKGAEEIYREYNKLHDVHLTNDDLKQDNELLHRMVDKQAELLGNYSGTPPQPSGTIATNLQQDQPTNRIMGEKQVEALLAAQQLQSQRG